jgi:hypothetical protein
LYAVSNQSRLFTVNTASGALTAIGTGLTQLYQVRLLDLILIQLIELD